HLHAETDLVHGRGAGEPAFRYGPLHDVEQTHRARGEVRFRYESDVAAAGSLIHLVNPVTERHILHIFSTRNLLEILSPDHDLGAAGPGNAVDPDVICDVIDPNVRTGFGKG